MNPADVDLVPPGDDDAEWLHDIIERHAKLTRSELAAALLADWPDTLARFTTIYPRQFRRVVAAIALARQEGRDPELAVMEVSGG